MLAEKRLINRLLATLWALARRCDSTLPADNLGAKLAPAGRLIWRDWSERKADWLTGPGRRTARRISVRLDCV